MKSQIQKSEIPPARSDPTREIREGLCSDTADGFVGSLPFGCVRIRWPVSFGVNSQPRKPLRQRATDVTRLTTYQEIKEDENRKDSRAKGKERSTTAQHALSITDNPLGWKRKRM